MKLLTLGLFAITAALALVPPLTPRHDSNEATTRAPALTRRFNSDTLASDDLWKAVKCKGELIVYCMQASDAEAGARHPQTKHRNPPTAKSDWQGDLKQEFQTWGWHDIYTSQSYAELKTQYKVRSVLDSLGINAEPKINGGKNIAYHVEHDDPDMKDNKGNKIDKKDQKYKVDGKEYRMTQASHTFIMNPSDGVIIGQDLTGPSHAASQRWGRAAKSDELPKLRALSDVFWGYWNRENPNLKNIRYFWMADVENADTQAILARALKNVNKELTEWPGVTFGMDTEEGQALLGSVNGAVFGWFLVQHKAQLGDKRISKVSAFFPDFDGRPSWWEGPHLIYHVVDVHK